jgi:hypothetical protein
MTSPENEEAGSFILYPPTPNAPSGPFIPPGSGHLHGAYYYLQAKAKYTDGNAEKTENG